MIAHFTTVHPRDDSRILSKELATLACHVGEDVRLYVQDGLGDENSEAGCRIIDTGPRLPRLSRVAIGGWRMFSKLWRDRPSVAHFHDPELLPWALLLRLRGIKVVYDVHEDVPRQAARNPGLPRWVQRTAPPLISLAEWVGARIINGIVAATPVIAARFPKKKTILVRNYPLLDELHTPDSTPMRDRLPEFTYVGSISEDRNIYAMIEAVGRLPMTDARLCLAGTFSTVETQRRAEAMPEWASVRFEGWNSREGVAAILARARAGLVVLKPVEHEMVTLPIKLFEYMAAGLPVISSDFELWREIVDGAKCGLLVDPTDIDSIVAAMQWILDHPEEAQRMGEAGRKAVLEQLNLTEEGKTLLAFYNKQLKVALKPSVAAGAH